MDHVYRTAVRSVDHQASGWNQLGGSASYLNDKPAKVGFGKNGKLGRRREVFGCLVAPAAGR